MAHQRKKYLKYLMVKKLFETDCYKKDYRQDLKKIKYLLQSKKHFAFSKYADGELHILANKPINNGEFWFDPDNNSFNRKKLIESFTYKEKNYFVSGLIGGLLFLQLALGISNIIYRLPLYIAIAHNLGALFLLLGLSYARLRSREY